MNKISPENILSKDYDVIIIGGGASGLFAASNIDANKKVLIIEKNDELGKKLKITGGGRCNILNYELDNYKLLENYGNAKNYLYSPFSKFGVIETENYFKSIGINIKVEDRKRAFPVSEKALDVYESLYKKIYNNKNIDIILNTELIKINFNSDKDRVDSLHIIFDKSDSNNLINIKAKKYIFSTGGYSHSYTGSDGKIINLLAENNIKITKPTPSLCPIKVKQDWINNSSGTTLNNIKIDIYLDDKKVKILNNKTKNIEKNINVLCTHFGLTGPSIINNSKIINDYLKEGVVTFKIDLFKNKDEKELDKYILEIFDKNKNKKLQNVLNQIYEGNILKNIFNDNKIEISKIDTNREVNDIKKEERQLMVKILKNLKINIDGLLDLDNSIIADGGIDVSEVDFNNMSLFKIKNLHVTGDMLDINRPSGGYSLQLCWTTGYIAGTNI